MLRRRGYTNTLNESKRALQTKLNRRRRSGGESSSRAARGACCRRHERRGSSSGGARSHKVGFSYGSTTGFSDPVRKSLSQNTMNTLVYILDVLLPGLLRCWRKFRRISLFSAGCPLHPFRLC